MSVARIKADLNALQICEDEATFFTAAKLFFEKWRKIKDQRVRDFVAKHSWKTSVSSINNPVSCSTMWSNIRKPADVKQNFTFQPLIHQNQVYESPPEISKLLANTYAKISANTTT